MKIKTSELTGAALDWAVAKCEGFTEYDPLTEKMLPPRREYGWVSLSSATSPPIGRKAARSSKRERIVVGPHALSTYSARICWDAAASVARPTPLIAGMRCYAASKLGHEVEVPEGLL